MVKTMPRKKNESNQAEKQEVAKPRTRNTSPVQLFRETTEIAALVASIEKKSIAELLEPLLRPWLTAKMKTLSQKVQDMVDELSKNSTED